MKEIGLGLIWAAGAMVVMGLCSRLYSRKETRKELYGFYLAVLGAGVFLRMFFAGEGTAIYLCSLGLMGILAAGTWRISGEKLTRILVVFSFVAIGAVFCEVMAGILFFRDITLSQEAVLSSPKILPAALLGNVLWVAYLGTAIHLWIRLEKTCVISGGRSLCVLVMFQAAALLVMVIAAYTGAVGMGPDFALAVILQVAGTVGILKLQVRNEEIRSMEQQVEELERESQKEYQRYVELEEEYKNLHQFRHDFHNQLTTAYYLAQSGEKEGAFQLLGEMEAVLKGGQGSGAAQESKPVG